MVTSVDHLVNFYQTSLSNGLCIQNSYRQKGWTEVGIHVHLIFHLHIHINTISADCKDMMSTRCQVNIPCEHLCQCVYLNSFTLHETSITLATNKVSNMQFTQRVRNDPKFSHSQSTNKEYQGGAKIAKRGVWCLVAHAPTLSTNNIHLWCNGH